ncbi:hypothetical protein KKB44_04420 [Candidatus Micrarchaeota archaeon]|nr:hypothetical protein [Candidatus Micrarchaeota archaeon]
MFIVYIYDIKAKNKKKFNRVKRRFYYHLNKLELNKEYWKTKSTFAVPPNLEKIIDLFFSGFKKNVIVYKIHAESIEALE